MNIRDKMLWLFLGILALRLIYVLVLHRFIRERTFSVYTWINAVLFAGIVANSVNLKSTGMQPAAANYLLSCFYWVVPAGLSVWAYSILKEYNNPKKVKIIFYLLWLLAAAGLIAGLFFLKQSGYHFISNIYLQVALAFSFTTAAYILWKHKAAPAVFIIPGMFLIFNQCHYSLISLNVYPFKTWVLIMMSAFISTEVITMSLLLGNILKKSVRKNAETTEKLLKVRDKISADLHDELGSVLTQISLQSDMVNSGIYTDEEKRKELENISSTSRRALLAMSDIVWSVKAGHDRVSSLVDRMRDHADIMLQPLNTGFDFKVFAMDEEQEIDNQLRQELFLIYKEAVNNIVKHSQPQKILVTMGNRNNQFELLIQNDINCLKEKNKLGGNGLANMRQRAININAKFETVETENLFTVKLSRQSI